MLAALDGYDVLSITFAAPAISSAWELGKAALGIVFSSGLAGMALGSFFLAPLADRVGRKPITLLSLVLMGAGSLLSATAQTLSELIAWRALTGLGIGSCIAVVYPIAAEFSNSRHRALCIALTAIGYPLGGLIASIVASLLLDDFGWQGIFVAGFVAAAIMMPIVMAFMPESLGFLLSRDRSARDKRLVRLLQRCGLPQTEVLEMRRSPVKLGYAAVFEPGQRATTIRLTIVNALNVAVVYFVLNWMPQMVTDAGFSPAQSSRVAAIANIVGIFGGALLGVLARRIGLNSATSFAIFALGASTIVFGLTPPSYTLLMVAAGVSGFLLFASMTGIYATLAQSFRDEARASGTGFVIGVGRISSAIAPAIAGGLFAAGMGPAGICLVFGLVAFVAGLVFVWKRPPLSVVSI